MEKIYPIFGVKKSLCPAHETRSRIAIGRCVSDVRGRDAQRARSWAGAGERFVRGAPTSRRGKAVTEIGWSGERAILMGARRAERTTCRPGMETPECGWLGRQTEAQQSRHIETIDSL